MSDINIQLGNTKGVSRKIDSAGRIIIPMNFRKELDINEDSPWIEIFLLENGIYIKKKKFMYKGEK